MTGAPARSRDRPSAHAGRSQLAEHPAPPVKDPVALEPPPAGKRP